jgi:tRNA pseudouridine-54 N-methylase
VGVDVSDIMAFLPAGAGTVLLIIVIGRAVSAWLRVTDKALDVQDGVIEELRDELNRLAHMYRDPELDEDGDDIEEV